MKKDLEDNLRAQFPSLYADIDHIYCGDGWYQLILVLSNAIQLEINGLPTGIGSQIKPVQIKSKFGTLRYYLNHSTPYIDGAIRVAESMSSFLCEKCGEKAKQVRSLHGMAATLCLAHVEEKGLF